MSTGTAIIQRALQRIGAHSAIAPASPASITLGMERLNSMLEVWLAQGIVIGVTGLVVPGDDLNEKPDTRNGIIDKLALSLAPDFDNGKQIVSQQLKEDAKVNFAHIKNVYQQITIPNKVVSSTLPVGAGNSRGANRRTFFPKGGVVTDEIN